MKIIGNISSILLLLILMSCDDLDLGMKYQRLLIAQKGSDSLYCYRMAWARDSEALYLSESTNLCTGFDTIKDVCFGKGVPTIYYKYEKDTLFVYSNSLPKFSKLSSFNIKVEKIGGVVKGKAEKSDDSEGYFLLNYEKYEKEFQKGKINKIIYDNTNLRNVPCSPIPKISVYNMKFDDNGR